MKIRFPGLETEVEVDASVRVRVRFRTEDVEKPEWFTEDQRVARVPVTNDCLVVRDPQDRFQRLDVYVFRVELADLSEERGEFEPVADVYAFKVDVHR